jgi:hypothetical protein
MEDVKKPSEKNEGCKSSELTDYEKANTFLLNVKNETQMEVILTEKLDDEELSKGLLSHQVIPSDHLKSQRSASNEGSIMKPKNQTFNSAEPSKTSVFIHNQFRKIFENFTKDDPKSSQVHIKGSPSSSTLTNTANKGKRPFKSSSPSRNLTLYTEKSTLFSIHKKSPRLSEKSELTSNPRNSYQSIRQSVKSSKTFNPTFRSSPVNNNGPKTEQFSTTNNYNFKKKSPQIGSNGLQGNISKYSKKNEATQYSIKTSTKSPMMSATSKTKVVSQITNKTLRTVQAISGNFLTKPCSSSPRSMQNKVISKSKPTLTQTLKALEVKRLPSPPKIMSSDKKNSFPKPVVPPKLTFEEVKPTIKCGPGSSFQSRADRKRKEAKYRFTSIDLERDRPKTANEIAEVAEYGQNHVIDGLKLNYLGGKKSQESSIMGRLLEEQSQQERTRKLKANLHARFHQSMTQQCLLARPAGN